MQQAARGWPEEAPGRRRQSALLAKKRELTAVNGAEGRGSALPAGALPVNSTLTARCAVNSELLLNGLLTMPVMLQCSESVAVGPHILLVMTIALVNHKRH